jgi:fatty-acyl-CoA synthase
MTEIRIVTEAGDTADPGVEGELWVKSPAVAREYWQRPEASAETFVDGWCRTGDIGQITTDGVLRITGRQKDMIKSGGENIYPIEIEGVLTDHPKVADAAVIGVPDSKFQETVCAVLVREPAARLEQEEVVAYCRSRLAGFKRPKYVVFVDRLPRNAAGKVLKHVLRERYEHLGTPEGVA